MLCRRQIERRDERIFLQGRPVNLIPMWTPQILRFSNGYNNSSNFKTPYEIKKRLSPIVEDLCDTLSADCYEMGDMIVTWSSDPGFGSRTENYAVQFYKVYG